MDAQDVGRILEETAVLLELKGENPFKARAYANAGRVVRGLLDDINQVVADGRIGDVQGIGKTLAHDITELVTTGKMTVHEELRRLLPAGLLELTTLSGLGPKRIKAIYEKLGVTNVGELEYACRENRLASLEGFGEKTQQNLLSAIALREKHRERHLYHHAREAADGLVAVVRQRPDIACAEVAGSLRRHCETIRDIDILASAPASARKSIMEMFVSQPELEAVVARGETKSSVRLRNGMNADLRILDDVEYPYALNYFTGSKEHNTVMRARAKERRLKLNEYGLFRLDGEGCVACRDEPDIYRALGLAYIPPELREDMGEFEAAQRDALPHLVERGDIRGMLHVHTTASDGVNSIEELVTAARSMGMSYLGVCDHSQSAAYAGGLPPERVRQQWEEIDRINGKLDGFVVLKGIESDIRPDGSLDYDGELLSGFDFVVASIHSKLKMTEQEATERILRAIRNPAVSILGHPTGRLLLAREGYPVDLRAVIDEAARLGVAIELNASPHRLDLDWTWCKVAKAKGVKIAICPDAHSAADMRDIDIGVALGRKGWLEAGDVLNTLPVSEFREAITRRG